MHTQLWDVLLAEPIATRRLRLGIEADDEGRMEVPAFGRRFVVVPADRSIQCWTGSATRPANYLEQLSVLSYLIRTRPVAPSGRFVKPEQLPSGAFYFRGHHAVPVTRLAEAFGVDPARLRVAGEVLGGRRVTYGDAAVELDLFARVPAVFIVWGADEEFDARAMVLVDGTAADHLPLDALGITLQLAIAALVEAI